MKIWKGIKWFVSLFKPPVWRPVKPFPPTLTAPKDEKMPFIKITPGEVFRENLEAQKYAKKIEEIVNKMMPQERLEKMVSLYWYDIMVFGTSRPIQEYLKETE